MDDRNEAAPVQEAASPRRGLQIFRAADAPTLDEHGSMEHKLSGEAAAQLGRLAELGMSEGAELRVLYSAPGFSLTSAWFKPGYMLPLHAHDSDCLYCVIAGRLHMGTETLSAGDGFFLPANAWYSYSAGVEGVEILEFRHATNFDIKVRDGVPKLWEQLARACMIHRDSWPGARRPARHL